MKEFTQEERNLMAHAILAAFPGDLDFQRLKDHGGHVSMFGTMCQSIPEQLAGLPPELGANLIALGKAAEQVGIIMSQLGWGYGMGGVKLADA